MTARPYPAPHFEKLPPLSLYIHIPWCVRKCPYCDFFSQEKRSSIPEKKYLAALASDLDESLPMIKGRELESIYIGGGTPSLLSPDGMAELLDLVRLRVPVRENIEISMEANPGTFEAGKFRAFRECGVNRLSIGVQSFSQHLLHRLGRIHDADEAVNAAHEAKRFFKNINIDVMYGLPGQTLEDLDSDLTEALACGTPHLSIYQLALEPGSYYFKHPPLLPDEDTISAMQEKIEERTSKAGFVHYEVSGYAKPGSECFHNKNYWFYGDYLGIGAASHSKITLPDSRIIRRAQWKNPDKYMGTAGTGNASEESFDVMPEDRVFEFMLNALRLMQGFPPELFRERTGLPLSVIDGPVSAAVKQGLLSVSKDHMEPTELGKRFLNDLQEMFLPD